MLALKIIYILKPMVEKFNIRAFRKWYWFFIWIDEFRSRITSFHEGDYLSGESQDKRPIICEDEGINRKRIWLGML